MANLEHLQILKQGVEVWNEWRREHKDVRPDLSYATLIGANLSRANLRYVDLSRANLINANLFGADIHYADISYADLSSARAIRAYLLRSNLSGANLISTNLSGANLSDVDLSRAELTGTYLIGADISGVDFTGARLAYTTFADNDLSRVKGLETVKHHAPSSIGIDTIFKSQGHIPEIFLRGCGVPEDFITYARSLTIKPIDFYSCFISYSSKDQEFAERLHTDLQAKGVRVWYAPHDLPIGARIRPAIDESIRVYDKLLLVLSKASVTSQWVEQEVETALASEREQEGKTVLFPIRVDDAIMEIKSGWPALLKNTRNVGDFTHWKDHDSYQRAFDRLLRDLRAEEKR